MTASRKVRSTIRFVDEYCDFYRDLFSEVRSFEALYIFAVLTCTAAQRGPLWWLSHHRHHHVSADTLDDPHSPQFGGLFQSHV
ncbi:MAG: hypothetical protein AAFR31_22095, partial [Cyanobacteria bacterium J06627_8]